MTERLVTPGDGGRQQLLLAWSVHLFTASGAALALLAWSAIDRQRWTEAMVWLAAALVVDGIDGTFARAARVKQLVPRIDGDSLDLVIDYLTYVFIPVLFMVEAELLPPPLALPLGAAVLISSLYVFARRDMKTDDGYFRGFPALWNVVAFYLYVTGLAPAAAAVIVLALVVMTFAPIHVVHPFRVRDFGLWLPIVTTLWAIATAALLLPDLQQSVRSLLLALSFATALILFTLGFVRTARGNRQTAVAPE